MANNDKQLEAKLLAKPVNQMSDSEIDIIIRDSQQERATRNRQKQAEAKEKVIIKDFKDERVKPFESGAIYNIYNLKTETELMTSGKYLESIIATDDANFKQFEKKQVSFPMTVDNKEITFKHFEIN